MSKRILPKTKSRFLKIKCLDCGNEQPVFNKCQTVAICLVCGASLSKPTGGHTEVRGEIINILDNELSN